MEEAIKENPELFCRACLNTSANMVSLTKVLGKKRRTLADVLSFVSNTTIKCDQKLPKQICVDCESIVIKADEFRQKCVESQKLLCKIFGSFVAQPSITIRKIKKEERGSKSDKKPSLTRTQSADTVKREENMKTELDTISCGSDEVIAKFELKRAIKNEVSDFSDDNDMDVDFLDNNEATTFDNDIGFLYGYEVTKKEDGIKDEKPLDTLKTQKYLIPIKCECCNRIFKTEKTFMKHKKICLEICPLTEIVYVQCSLCMRKFKKKSALIAHLKHHEMRDSIKFVCEFCKREFKHQGHLDNHIASMHKEKVGLSCEYCFSLYPNQETLDVHKEKHKKEKQEKRHSCHICNKSFNMLSTLTDHLRIHSGEKPFLCSICGRGFSQKTNLAQHMRRHLGLKPYKCKECERQFVSKGELDAHSRKHSGAHPFVCSECGSGFTTSSSLVKHRRTHTGERPYSCDLCPMKFTASGTLKNHRRTHTGEKPYQCSYCEKAFVQRQDLVSHIRCHTGERPFICNVCGQAFRKSSGLKTHVRMHKEQHNMEMPGMMNGVSGSFGS